MADPGDPMLLPALVGSGSALAVWAAQAATARVRAATRRGGERMLQDAAIALAWFCPEPRKTLARVCAVKEIPMPPSHYCEKVWARLDKAAELHRGKIEP